MPALADAKQHLRVDHALDDDLIQRLIDAALAEYVQFTGLTGDAVPATADAVPADAFNGLVLMVQAGYDGDPEKRDRYRRAAETLWQPYRTDMGV